MPASDVKNAIQQILEEASLKTGNGSQFLPILVLLEAAAAIATIWGECIKTDRPALLVKRAASMPWTAAASRVRLRIYDALPLEYRNPEFVEEVIRRAAAKLNSGQVPN